MKENKNYVTGIIGALIGGFIATIPWIIVYVYLNMMFSLLAILIAMGALKGYQIFKGKVDKKLPIIIVIVSLICITVSTLIVIPGLLLAKEGLTLSVDSIKMLYENSEFVSAIIRDYIISFIFTILGISGVIRSIRNQVSENKTDEIKATIAPNVIYELRNQNLDKVKEAFISLNALDKDSAVCKEDVIKKLDFENAVGYFNNFKLNGYIKKVNNKYYFSLEKYKNPNKGTLKVVIITILVTCLAIFIVSGILILLIDPPTKNQDNIETNEVKILEGLNYKVPEGWEFNYDYNGEYYYYPIGMEDGKSGVISIAKGESIYIKEDYERFLDDLEYKIKNYIENQDSSKDKYIIESYKIESLDDINNYKVLLATLSYTDESVEKLYYILDDYKYVLVYSTDYKINGIDIDSASMVFVNSIKFIENNF